MDMHLEGVIFHTYAEELERRIRRPHPPFLVLDVRPREEFDRGHIAGAVSWQPDPAAAELPAGSDAGTEFFIVGAGPEDRKVRQASLALRGLGARRCVELPGGMREWRQLGKPLEAAA